MQYRYQLQRYKGKASRYSCPSCGQKQKFIRWEDTRTGVPLPEAFGVCERLDSCGYALSPYNRGPDGSSYAEQQHTATKTDRALPRSRPTPRPHPTLCLIPEAIVRQTLAHYENNVFAQLLRQHFGFGVAAELLRRFEIGTSSHWPGSTVFWQRDELSRVRGGQVVLFDLNGHTAKRVDRQGNLQRCTTWVHTALAQAHRHRNLPLPAWLSAYLDPANDVKKSPSLYGLGQLLTAPQDKPVAVVEAPKTAAICTAYSPAFTWLAVGSLSNLTEERLRPLKSRSITLYPDAAVEGRAYEAWNRKAATMQRGGYAIKVSDLLELQATAAQKSAGIDLADLLLDKWAGYPPSWD